MDLELRQGCAGLNFTAHDKESSIGLMYLPSGSSCDISSIENTVECDWIFECDYSRHVLIGSYVVCESRNLESVIPSLKNNVFFFTGFSWIYLENKNVHELLVEGIKKRVFIGTEFSFEDLLENTCLKTCLTDACISRLSLLKGSLLTVDVCHARCKESMYLLDDLHRAYIQDHSYSQGDVIVVKAGAGSGKTTTQLRLAARFSEKRILYLAFNKSLVQEIEGKLSSRGITNMTTLTFDALLRRAYIKVKGVPPEVSDLKPQTITGLVPWLQGKSRKLKSYYCKQFSKFCSDVNYVDMVSFCKGTLGKEVKILEELWQKVLNGSLITFDAIRKLSFIGHWFKQSIDREYDMIFVDEIQDFDMAMLRMLLDDTTLPKLFVGDPRQSIYQWRGCINAFEYMPKNALTVEFYSTFRVGEPALSQICSRFKDCYMISKASHSTHFGTIDGGNKYVYLFRSWRQLLTTARETTGMWIYGFEQKIVQMRNLHEKLQGIKDVDDMEFEDDLPSFLLSMSSDELNELICDIARNIVSKEESRIKFYTVHSYKGMEDDIIRVASDVSLDDDPNLYYVALTRCLKKVTLDEGNSLPVNKENTILDILMGIVPLKKDSATTASATTASATTASATTASATTASATTASATTAKLPNEKKKVKMWTADEDTHLMDLIGRGLSYDEIAESIGRSSLAVEFRLLKKGVDLVIGGQSLDTVITLTKIDRVSLEEAIDQERIRLAATNKGARWDEKEINKVLGLVKTGTSVNKIAILCGRTISSIKEKLFDQAGKYGLLGFSVGDIIKITGLDAVEVNTAIVSAKRKAEL